MCAKQLDQIILNQPDQQKIMSDDKLKFPGNRAFAPALLDPDLELPAGMIDPDGRPAPKRFSVYRNNVVTSLMEAIGETYPSTKRIIGEKNFSTLSRIFISTHPPSSPMMQAYGEEFPDFIKKFKPLQHSPFLAELALVEKYWIAAYHAADINCLGGADLGKIPADDLMETRFIAHPATSIVSSEYSLYDLFLSGRQSKDANPAQVSYQKSDSAQAVLITRPHLSVELVQLDQASSEFFKRIITRNSLGQCVEGAMELDNGFDAASAIALMLSSGALCEIVSPNTN
jgi:hypothetical protein